MPREWGRRHVLRTALAATAAVGAGQTGWAATAAAGPASGAGTGAGTGAGAATAAGRGSGPDLPPVPGMHGDRRANEMWYLLDQLTFYHPSQEVRDAYNAIGSYLGGGIELPLRDRWLEMVRTPEYPRNFTAFVTPVKQPMEVLSRVQLHVYEETVYGPGDPRLTAAFGYFGEGVLYDPRSEDPATPVHTMGYGPNGEPPIGYHVWYVYLRSMMFLGIARERWARIAPLIAFAWALQSLAKPAEGRVNPPLPRRMVAEQAVRRLPRGTRQLDQDFQSLPYPRDL
ncbi:hypothetical protein [Streptomyces sp. MST-110588]|uniref:hypothetical protein n=1 Tax=Streptomyces sp. MST-110588 TaxID=2833628 RepID=UPI001F5CADB9|nr:hypothetical protein [Streptomyces sp. MST-110588]UNO44334.1 hypothetical protein KGS77_30805 [Streptomyces sp. MST-110588]